MNHFVEKLVLSLRVKIQLGMSCYLNFFICLSIKPILSYLNNIQSTWFLNSIILNKKGQKLVVETDFKMYLLVVLKSVSGLFREILVSVR